MSNIEILFFTHKLFSFLEIKKEKIPNILLSNKGRLKTHQENISSEFALPNVQQSNRGQGWTNTLRHSGKNCNCKANTCRVKGELSHLRAARDRFIYAWLIYMPGVKRSAASDSTAPCWHDSLWNKFHEITHVESFTGTVVNVLFTTPGWYLTSSYLPLNQTRPLVMYVTSNLMRGMMVSCKFLSLNVIWWVKCGSLNCSN